MATPEDLSANPENIRMGFVDVPEGSKSHNYATVTLIVEWTRVLRVDQVWTEYGWGHASGNLVLPETLAALN